MIPTAPASIRLADPLSGGHGPGGGAQTLGLRAAARRLAARRSCARAIEREAVTRPPAGPGANAGARSSTRPPWAPTPGSRKHGARHQLAQRAAGARGRSRR